MLKVANGTDAKIRGGGDVAIMQGVQLPVKSL